MKISSILQIQVCLLRISEKQVALIHWRLIAIPIILTNGCFKNGFEPFSSMCSFTMDDSSFIELLNILKYSSIKEWSLLKMEVKSSSNLYFLVTLHFQKDLQVIGFWVLYDDSFKLSWYDLLELVGIHPWKSIVLKLNCSSSRMPGAVSASDDSSSSTSSLFDYIGLTDIAKKSSGSIGLIKFSFSLSLISCFRWSSRSNYWKLQFTTLNDTFKLFHAYLYLAK